MKYKDIIYLKNEKDENLRYFIYYKEDDKKIITEIIQPIDKNYKYRDITKTEYKNAIKEISNIRKYLNDSILKLEKEYSIIKQTNYYNSDYTKKISKKIEQITRENENLINKKSISKDIIYIEKAEKELNKNNKALKRLNSKIHRNNKTKAENNKSLLLKMSKQKTIYENYLKILKKIEP